MSGAVGLARACAHPRWRQARDGHRALLGGAKARGGQAIFWDKGCLGWREEVVEATLIWRARGGGGGSGTTFGEVISDFIAADRGMRKGFMNSFLK